ncbi:hypothetical protein [Acidimangrovimonas pyrenivorans]|uniref:Uncharacterized protein n=1 Tax=Acidimangrovimonas pyrenivorans TaxID=2030798 RepID=A0ABV7ACR3_9RHOB
MTINDKYIVREHAVSYLQNGERTFLGLRLAHGLMYWMHQYLDGETQRATGVFHKERIVRCRDIADAVGPVGATDNDWLRVAVNQLEGQGLFRSVQVEGQRLHFHLSESFLAAYSRKAKGDSFAIIRTDHIRACGTLHDILFLTLASMHGGRDYPKFSLPRILREPAPSLTPIQRLELGLKREDQEKWRKSWEVSSKSWVRAATRASALLNHAYLIAPQHGIFDNHVSNVVVKVSHGKTKWSPERLYKFRAGTRNVVEIHPSGKRVRLNKAALKSKLYQTNII